MMLAGAVAAAAFLFDQEPVGGLPRGWTERGGRAAQVYRIESEPNGNRYLAARTKSTGVQLGVPVDIDARIAGVLSWRWRVWELPQGADERNPAAMDSAAAVYVVFGSRLFPRILKYVWSSSLPVGAVVRHPSYKHMAIVVVASGSTGLFDWRRVSRNVLADASNYLGEAPERIRAIGVKTDSASTRTSARADYDDLQFSAVRQ
jgi:hypothetical protein